jgi:hypothetical protein
MKTLLSLILSLFLTAGQLWSQIEVSMPIRNLAVGETGQFHVSSIDMPLIHVPKQIQANGFELKLSRKAQTLTYGNKLKNIYSYTFVLERSGEFLTPFIEVETPTQKVTLAPLPFSVHPLESFDQQKFSLGTKDFTYYSKIFPSKRNVFINECIEVEVRYILPLSIQPLEWGVSSTPSANHLFAGELSIPDQQSGLMGYDLVSSRMEIKNTKHLGIAYHTLIYGESPGKDSYGPISVSCVFTISRHLSNGLSRIENIRENLITEASSISVLPLPPDAPTDFKGDVGEFEMITKFPENLEVKEGGSLKITATIKGKGNYVMLNQPKIKNPEDWKIVDVTKEVSSRGPSLKNEATFSFLVSPKFKVDKTPEFYLHIFNAEKLAYETIRSEVLPVQFVSVTAPEVLSSPPLENQQDLLGFITPDRLQDDGFSSSLGSYWHLIPFIVVLTLLFIWGKKYFHHYRLTKGEVLERRNELNLLSKNELAEVEFFRAVGKFVERWHGGNQSPEIQHLLEERDKRCFVPEAEKSKSVLGPEVKETIIKLLKSLSLLFLLVSLTPELQASNDPAAQAIEAGRIDEALRIYQTLQNPSADVLYNIGVCYYKKGEMGSAALYFHRACLKESDHPEAKQNLKFLAKKLMHPVYIEEKKSDQWVTLLSKNLYLFVFQFSFWSLVILSLWLFLFTPRAKVKLSLIIALCLMFCLGISSQVLLQLFPKSIYFAPLSQLSVVVKASQKLQTEPTTLLNEEEGDKYVVEVPEASLCRVIAKRASWAYIELPSKTRGWIKQDSIKGIQELDPNPLESHQP